MDYDILKEENGLRVKLSIDEYPDEPYNDGQSPLLRLDRMGYGPPKAEHIMVGSMRPTSNDERIEEAAERWYQRGDHHMFEKYMRAFHGSTTFKWYGPNQSTDYTYVTYDTPEWAEAIGFDDVIAPRASYGGSKAVNMDEYIAYLEGEVYVYDVERQVQWQATYPPEEVGREHMNTWETVDSCGGYYGYEYAKEEALVAFERQERSA